MRGEKWERWVELSRFSVETVLPTVAKVFVGEPFCGSETFWYGKILCIKGMYHDFPSKLFCLPVPTHFVEDNLCVSQNLWSRKMFGIRKGGTYHDSPSSVHETLRLTLRENFTGENFWKFKKASILKIFHFPMKTGEERLPPISVEFFFVSQYRNFSQRPHSVFQNFPGLEIFYG